MSETEELIRLLNETASLREQFVQPIYLELLHANFVHRRNLTASQLISTAANAITDEQLRQLLNIREWRGRLTAGWLIGISKRRPFVEEIGRLLMASEMTYSGQGYCVALGLIGQDACKKYLEDYLLEYLPFQGRFYDQHWAIGALAHIDKDEAAMFLSPDLWPPDKAKTYPQRGISNFERIVDYLAENGMLAK